MLRAIQRARAKHQARRQAEASARCDRIIVACTDPNRRAVLIYAASMVRDPVLRARRLADLTMAFNYGV